MVDGPHVPEQAHPSKALKRKPGGSSHEGMSAGWDSLAPPVESSCGRVSRCAKSGFMSCIKLCRHYSLGGSREVSRNAHRHHERGSVATRELVQEVEP